MDMADTLPPTATTCKRTYVRYDRAMEQFERDHEIEHLRRSLAMLPAGADALKREEAMALLGPAARRHRPATAGRGRSAGAARRSVGGLSAGSVFGDQSAA